MKQIIKLFFQTFVSLFLVIQANANGITVTNVTVLPNSSQIQFDVTWENSWRSDVLQNWDAAWVFIKFQDVDVKWNPMVLTDVNNVIPAGYTANVVTDKRGVFLYRSAAGSGTSTITGVKLGIPSQFALGVYDIKVFAIEMVYIPTAAFWVGDNQSSANSYTSYNSLVPSSPANISNSGAIFTDPLSGGSFTVVSAPYPSGFNNFYCMKYEVSQGAYRDFLNTLSYLQQTSLTFNLPSSVVGTRAMTNIATGRSSIKIAVPGVQAFNQPAVYGCDANNNNIFNESGDGEWVACNFISWCDLSTYLSWAALAPMTELQFEKICRGPLQPVTAEYAWGTNSIGTTGFIVNNLNSANEIISNPSGVPTEGNASYFSTNNNIGPLRNGIFATATSNRISSAGSFYGVMEMSGNLWERLVTTANTQGRAFDGSHGVGVVISTGFTSGNTWPVADGITTPAGLMYRGGSLNTPETEIRVSNRNSNSLPSGPDNGFSGRLIDFGGRGVRNL